MTETRRQRQRRELEADILDEARRQLETNGPGAIGLRAIARAVGVSAPSLYTYFASLDDIITALLLQSYRALANAVRNATDEVASAEPGLRLFAGPAAYRKWALANRHQFNLLFSDQIRGYQAPPGGPTVDAQIAIFQPMIEPFAQVTGALPDSFERSGADLTRLLGFWGTFHGLTTLEVNHHLDWVDGDQIFEATVRAAIVTLREPPLARCEMLPP